VHQQTYKWQPLSLAINCWLLYSLKLTAATGMSDQGDSSHTYCIFFQEQVIHSDMRGRLEKPVQIEVLHSAHNASCLE
jgi:hypothetical protein